MMAWLISCAALLLAGVILVRCICVLYQTTAKKHRHPLLFLGFGYSYVVLGSGGIVAAVALGLDHHDLAEVALWLMLIGSTGLIAFDRRRQQCWAVTHCPAEAGEEGGR